MFIRVVAIDANNNSVTNTKRSSIQCVSGIWVDNTILPSPSLKIDNNGTKLVSTVYPNPSNGLIKINIPNLNQDNFSLKVYDISGREINEIQYTFNPNKIIFVDFHQTLHGSYIIEITNNSQVIRKIINIY